MTSRAKRYAGLRSSPTPANADVHAEFSPPVEALITTAGGTLRGRVIDGSAESGIVALGHRVGDVAVISAHHDGGAHAVEPTPGPLTSASPTYRAIAPAHGPRAPADALPHEIGGQGTARARADSTGKLGGPTVKAGTVAARCVPASQDVEGMIMITRTSRRSHRGSSLAARDRRNEARAGPPVILGNTPAPPGAPPGGPARGRRGDLSRRGRAIGGRPMMGREIRGEEPQQAGCAAIESPNSPGGDLECSPLNISRPIDWRWRRASFTTASTTPSGQRLDDRWVRRARRYLVARDLAARVGGVGEQAQLTSSWATAIEAALGLRSLRPSRSSRRGRCRAPTWRP